jgi:hypothetical protein
LPEVGDAFTAWYDATLPAPMIYPPRFEAAAFGVNLPALPSVKVARFDADMLSYDGELKIHIGENTVLLQANGEPFVGGQEALAGRALVALYSITTHSMPPQTTPEKIFVLYERAVPLPGIMEIGVTGQPLSVEFPIHGIKVHGELIDTPEPFLKGFTVMVPLRAISEALAYTVQWEEATQSIMLNNVVSVIIGRDYYTYARMAPIELGHAPEIVNGVTYVPLNFFRQVVPMNNAYFFEGLIEINNEERME